MGFEQDWKREDGFHELLKKKKASKIKSKFKKMGWNGELKSKCVEIGNVLGAISFLTASFDFIIIIINKRCGFSR